MKNWITEGWISEFYCTKIIVLYNDFFFFPHARDQKVEYSLPILKRLVYLALKKYIINLHCIIFSNYSDQSEVFTNQNVVRNFNMAASVTLVNNLCVRQAVSY